MRVLLILFCTFLLSAEGFARVYKYQDEQGNWHFSDRPPDNVQNQSVIKESPRQATSIKDLKTQLYDKYPPQSAVQEATLATVTVQAPLGSGSGFFASQDGFIITNKHVVQFNENQEESVEAQIERANTQLEAYRSQIKVEQSRLKKFQAELADYRADISALRAGDQKQRELSHYELLKKQHRQREKELSAARQEVAQAERKFRQQLRDFEWKRTVASATRNFTVVMKDGTKMTAYLVLTSKDYDLALLKLENVKTPALSPAGQTELGQGVPVYAIGSPAGHRDSVSEGIISGFERHFVKTDAKIYPGNSGGPLILEDGRVIGINTMKKITYKYEGLGYAINIATALQAFANYLKNP